ncbi:hypothetical protein JDS82_28565 [Bacillus cereus group sp. N14]|uniref:hypothetical protein n=1 Tax=Bacillus cereus group sp. N14 TaxID=2794587 RepID=UPI0018F27A08|nr:hypothetical protein [Bacillus cereus group sp. N14]MBJ8085070.1 hypothetical protein [Bacillus cereus group sp. N14]
MDYIISNKDWIFSGIGIFIISGIISFIRKKSSIEQENSKHQSGNNNIQADGDVTVNHTTNVYEKKELEVVKSPLIELANKFYSILENHGISRVQIPSFIDKKFNIHYADVADEHSIIPKISDELLEWISLKLGIRRSWFDAKDDLMYNSVYCYRDVWEFRNLFNKLIDEFTVYDYKDYLRVYFLKTFKDFNGDKSGEEGIAEVIIIVSVQIGETHTNAVNKYILITANLSWDYEKSRQDIKRMIRIADKLRIDTRGFDISKDEYQEIASGKVVPRAILSKKRITWYPEDYNGSFNDRIDEIEYEHSESFQDSLRSIDDKVDEMLEEKRQQFK